MKSISTSELQRLASRWRKLGIGFNVAPAGRTPDVERLLIATASAVQADARLFEMVVSWLIQNARLVAVHRLAAMAQSIREDRDASPALGLMLELAEAHGATRSFGAAVRACVPAREPDALFDIDRRSAATVRLVRDGAVPISVRWGRWIDEFTPHVAALRPLDWIVAHNRAALSKRLTLSDADLSAALVLAESGERLHAAELARRAGISRMQARRSIDRLQLLGHARTSAKSDRSRACRLVELKS
jgi:hypothetical protein